MARFYASIQGNRGEATRMGTEKTGMTSYTASWDGAVRVDLEVRDGVDWAYVSLVPWHGSGVSKQLFDGPVSGKRRPRGSSNA